MGSDQAGAGEDAVAALEKVHAFSGETPFTLGFLGYVSGRAGRRDDTRRLLERAEKLATASHVPASTFALCHIGLGDWDAAFERMERAIETRDPIIMPIKSDPFLDPVRGDGR